MMNSRSPSIRTVLSLLLLSTLMAACGEGPESMLVSARKYLSENDNRSAVIQIKNALQSNPNLPEARYLLGSALLNGGDPVGAETELRKALALNYAQDLVLPALAKALVMQGKARNLIDEFSAVKLGPPFATASLQASLASAYATLGQTELSQAAINAALRADPDHLDALLASARLKAGQRDFDAALALVEAVIVKSPGNFDAWKFKGDVLFFAKNQADQALLAYKKAVEIKPGNLGGYAALVTLLLQQGKLAEAQKLMPEMKRIAGNHPGSKYLEAQLAFQKKDFSVARDLLQQVLRVVPDNVQVLQLAGAVELQLNSTLRAEDYLSKALQLAPNLALARRLLIATYLRTGNATKALAALLPGLSQASVDPELLALAGEVYLQSGDAKKAEEYFSRSSETDPGNAKKRTSLALMHLVGGQVDSAYRELRDIAATDPGTTANMALISAHLRRKEFDKALSAIDELEKKLPRNPATFILRGRALQAKQDVAGARRSFEDAVKIDPGFYPAAASLAAMELADNKPDAARKRLEALLQASPNHSQALLALAELAIRSGAAKDQVIESIGKAVRASPAEAPPRLLLIDYLLKNKDVAQASSAAQEAVAALPDSPELFDALGQTQYAAQELNQAMTTYNKLATLQPQSPLAHLRLADIYLARNNKDAAAQSLRKALAIKPDLKQAQRGLIMLDVDRKNYQGALTTARAIQKQAPDEVLGYALEGDINVSRKNWPDAEAAYSKGLKQVSSPELAVKLHTVLLTSGKTVAADKLAIEWQKNNPKDVVFILYLGDGALARKDYVGAEKSYLAAIELQPNSALAYNNLAWVTAKLNKDGAINYAQKANALAPDQPALMDTLAVLLSDQGDYAKAVALQRAAIGLQPENPVLNLNLVKMHLKAGMTRVAKNELLELQKLGQKFAGQAEVNALLKTLE